MNIIGINGFKRSGKGEVHLAIERLRPDLNVKGVGFADKLKVLAAKTLGFGELSDAECIALMDEAKQDWAIGAYDIAGEQRLGDGHAGMSGRAYLQNLGNEARNVFGDTFWVDQVLMNPAAISEHDWSENDNVSEYVAEQYPGVDILCITDVRYSNEAERIRACGGVVWEVIRQGVESDGHASEQRLPLNLIDWHIYNDGNLAGLEAKVRHALEAIL